MAMFGRLLVVLVLLHGSAGAVMAADAISLVVSRAGDIPILITAPHGGLEDVPHVSLRRRGTTTTDTQTLELAEALAQHVTKRLGAEPYLVAARFSRKYIDANREEGEAFDSPHAKPVYEAYHGHVRRFIAQIRGRFPRGAVLLDLHGQSGDPEVVHRGTRNGATVAALVRMHGPQALTGPNSILGVVQSKGYQVFPSGTPIGSPPEDRRYNGGYTVHTYGSETPDGVDAIQIEVGRGVRTDGGFIAALGEGIAVFYRTYLAGP